MSGVVRRYVLPAIVIEAALVGLISLDTPFQSFAYFIALTTLASAAFAVAARNAWRDRDAPAGALVFVVVAAVVFRATLLPFEAADDVNRYVWEGRIQTHGFNPFTHAPDAPALEALRDDVVWPGMNGKPYTAIYPPLAQLLFRAIAMISPTFTAMKVVFSVFDLLTAFLVLALLRHRGAPAMRVLVYLWCPLLLFTIAGRGHLDAMQTFFMMGSIALAARERTAASGFLLGLAILSKTTSVLILPALALHARRPLRLWPVVLPFALYVVYLDAGSGLFRSLTMFSREWSTNAALYLPLTFGSSVRWPAYLAAAVTLAVVLLRARRPEDAAFGTWGVFTVFTPTFHPWYFNALVPFLALRRRPAWLLLSATLFLYYAFLMEGRWQPIGWIPWLEYGPFFLMWVVTRAVPRDPRAAGAE